MMKTNMMKLKNTYVDCGGNGVEFGFWGGPELQ